MDNFFIIMFNSLLSEPWFGTVTSNITRLNQFATAASRLVSHVIDERIFNKPMPANLSGILIISSILKMLLWGIAVLCHEFLPEIKYTLFLFQFFTTNFSITMRLFPQLRSAKNRREYFATILSTRTGNHNVWVS